MLSERAGPTDRFAAAPVGPGRPKDGLEVNAGVVVEVGVFRGDGGLAAGGRERFQRQGGMLAAMGVNHLVEQAAVPVKDERAGCGGAAENSIRRGKIGEERGEETAGGKRQRHQGKYQPNIPAVQGPHDRPFDEAHGRSPHAWRRGIIQDTGSQSRCHCIRIRGKSKASHRVFE